ncbi:MAG: fimbria/pilus periplasmic chaperone [Endozoicomonadaceae bacterium]|nr:fimbria/pilus periplasmic chaperone [Endozoicomonadaceae bacterium]
MKLIKYGYESFIFIIALIVISSNAHLSPESTRVIFHQNNEFETIRIHNNSANEVYGLEAWTESSNSDEPENSLKNSVNNKFVISPKFTLDSPGEDVVLHITKLPDVKLPEDRESLFYITLQEVPQRSVVNQLTGRKQNIQNALQLAIRTKIKLIYRPEKIKQINPEEIKKQFSATIYNDTMVITNTSSSLINAINLYPQSQLKKLLFDDVLKKRYQGLLNTPVILKPFSNTVIPVEKNSHINSDKIHLAYINDNGKINLFSVRIKKEKQSFVFKPMFK